MYNDSIIQFLGKLPFREGGFHGSLKQIRLPDGSADSIEVCGLTSGFFA